MARRKSEYQIVVASGQGWKLVDQGQRLGSTEEAMRFVRNNAEALEGQLLYVVAITAGPFKIEREQHYRTKFVPVEPTE